MATPRRVAAAEPLLRLARGLLGHPANAGLRRRLADRADAGEHFHRQTVGLLFRLLFVKVAEEAGLLFGSGIAERRQGEGDSLFARLAVVFEGLSAGCPERGLRPLGSALWSADALPDLAGCRLADADLLACVAALPSAGDLGDFYAKLLEFHPLLDLAGPSFELVEAAGHRRKTSGSYYTPDSLIDCLLASALDPVVDEVLRRPAPEQALLALRICDPACGSGRFLVAAGGRLAARLAVSRGADSAGAKRQALRDVIANCLYGMDSDPLAVELCKVALWLECDEPGRTLGFLAGRIDCGNSLLEDPPGAAAGFDVVLTNPPWERLKLQEKEWFAARCPAVAAAGDAHARRQLILTLKEQQPHLFVAYRAAAHRAEADSNLIRRCGRYPLSSRGDLNAYGPFVELSRRLLRSGGRAGLVVPSGLATDDSLKDLFQDLLKSGQVVSWYDFHNRRRLFPGVQGNVKFGLLTLSMRPHESFAVAAQLEDPAQLAEPGRTYRLSVAAVGRLNPNTLHCPTFTCARDAEIVARIHERFPVLVREQPPSNPWGLRPATMFHMTHDAALFRRLETLQGEGWRLEGNVFHRGADRYLPLYEAKLVRGFNHRAATFAGVAEAVRFRTHARTRSLAAEELADPRTVVLPRYWLPEEAVRTRSAAAWFLGFRNAISAVADARSLVAAVVPRAGVGNSLPLVAGPDARSACLLLGLLNSFVLDYVLRQKASGGNLNFHVFRQLPVPAPETFRTPCPWSQGETLADWFAGRVLELTYTSWELENFARACGCERPPFAWDEERRQQVRGEIDAACFLLYGLDRADTEHILGTFAIAERQEIRQHGRSLSRATVLACLDRLTAV